MFSRSSLELFEMLLANARFEVTADTVEAQAAQLGTARRELRAAMTPESEPCSICGQDSRQAVDGIPCVACKQYLASRQPEVTGDAGTD